MRIQWVSTFPRRIYLWLALQLPQTLILEELHTHVNPVGVIGLTDDISLAGSTTTSKIKIAQKTHQ